MSDVYSIVKAAVLGAKAGEPVSKRRRLDSQTDSTPTFTFVAPAPVAAPPPRVGGKAARVRQQKRHSGVPAAPDVAAEQPALPARTRIRTPSAGTTKPKRAAAEEAAEPPPLTKRQKLMHSVHLRPAVVTPAAKGVLSFDADWHDHCETPFEAFRDVEPLLFQLASRLGRTKASLRLYDPYYCEGSMVTHLARLGFESVSNTNTDCYAAQAAGTVPPFDVLITNPPYSGDHMPRCLRFAAACGKPWLLLLPNFVCRKKDFGAAVARCPPAYIVPARRYTYYAPGRREEQTQATSPFDSFWYVWLGDGEAMEALLGWWQRKYAKASGCTLARSPEELPAPVREEPRANPARRRKEAKRVAFMASKFGIAPAHVRPAKKASAHA